MIKEEFTLPSGEDAYWCGAEDDRRILLTYVGIGSTIHRNPELLHQIGETAGMRVLAVELAGHGENPQRKLGDITMHEHTRQVHDNVFWLLCDVRPAQLNMMGTSYGAYLAAHQARFAPVVNLVLRTPALYHENDYMRPLGQIDMRDTMALRRSRLRIAAQEFFRLPFVNPVRTLVVAHGADTEVPRATSLAFAKSFHADLMTVANAPHSINDPHPPGTFDNYAQKIGSWLHRGRSLRWQ
jgi:hypothetical protein